jgi:S-adenosylmethionine:tRNA ribosyltransferase-isomerase
MIAARNPRNSKFSDRLLVLNNNNSFHFSVDPDVVYSYIVDSHIGDLQTHLRPHDLLVVNDSATLPASLQTTLPSGSRAEIRLVSSEGDGSYLALLFGEGDWRTTTEARPIPAIISRETLLPITDRLTARIESYERRCKSGRLVRISFNLEKASLLTEIYRVGKPIQYSYMDEEIALWSVQNIYAGRPWSVEMPSAGRALSSAVLMNLRKSGVAIASLTHAAGISSTGDPALDAQLPFKERYEIPDETVRAIATARNHGGRIIAVGTSVVRALESSALKNAASPVAGASMDRYPVTGASVNRSPVAGVDETDLIIQPGFDLQVVDGLLTGMHESTESHFKLLEAFAPRSQLEAALQHAERERYLTHEFGDSCLIFSNNT